MMLIREQFMPENVCQVKALRCTAAEIAQRIGTEAGSSCQEPAS